MIFKKYNDIFITLCKQYFLCTPQFSKEIFSFLTFVLTLYRRFQNFCLKPLHNIVYEFSQECNIELVILVVNNKVYYMLLWFVQDACVKMKLTNGTQVTMKRTMKTSASFKPLSCRSLWSCSSQTLPSLVVRVSSMKMIYTK